MPLARVGQILIFFKKEIFTPQVGVVGFEWLEAISGLGAIGFVLEAIRSGLKAVGSSC